MSPELYIGVVVAVAGYLMLLTTGINGIRHARLMSLGFDGYAMSSIWLWIAGAGMIGLAISLVKIRSFGFPVAILYERGVEPFSFGLRQWANLVVGLAICTGICIRSFVMVRNAKRMTKQQQEEWRKTNKAMVQLRNTIDAGR